MTLMAKAFRDPVSLPTLVTIIKRHRNLEGFCRCCAQPWPCDVRIMSGILITEVPSEGVVTA